MGKLNITFGFHLFICLNNYLFIHLFIDMYFFSGSNCLAGCVFVISDYQECMDHDILDTWMDVSSTLTNTNR